MSEEQIRDILGEFLVHPLALFSFKIKKSSVSMIMEVVLDHLENQYGSVSLDDCENVSRHLGSKIEEIDPELDYQLKVQSAGAERELRLPDDLYRFSGLLMNLEILDEEGRSSFGVFKLLEIDPNGRLRLESFRSKGQKKSGKKPVLELPLERVKKGNLYIHI
ncbi:MAG: ribosome maturation factor RimP [Leptospira sp.]|nr:ribosome maturation factor RimP [Leptospira sp.]